MEIVMSILLSSLWVLIGNIGFSIWREKILEIQNPKLINEIVLLNTKLLRYKIRFLLAGPAGIIFAINYNEKKTTKGKEK